MGRSTMMKLSFRRKKPESVAPGVNGTARIDASTKTLTKRLQPGDIAVIDHLDIDRVSAEALVACEPAAVVNAARSSSGRYPNLGPGILVSAGIPLIDAVGDQVMEDVAEGTHARVDEDRLIVGERVVAQGTLLDGPAIDAAMEEARSGLSVQIEAFAENT